MLVDRKKQIEELKEIFGDEYNDYNLVFCHPTGRPMESQVINNALHKLEFAWEFYKETLSVY